MHFKLLCHNYITYSECISANSGMHQHYHHASHPTYKPTVKMHFTKTFWGRFTEIGNPNAWTSKQKAEQNNMTVLSCNGAAFIEWYISLATHNTHTQARVRTHAYTHAHTHARTAQNLCFNFSVRLLVNSLPFNYLSHVQHVSHLA